MVGAIVSGTDHSDFKFKNALRVLFHQCLAVRPLSGALQAQIRSYLRGSRLLAVKSLTEAPLLSTSARSVGVYGFCCASISTLVHIYNSGQHTHRAFFCHGGQMAVQKLAI